MLKSPVKHKVEFNEENFKALLPGYLKKASKQFFTPISIGQIAAQWLTEDKNKSVLDIGAGVGKFCITGAKYNNSFYFGIEYRKSLVTIANNIISTYELTNTTVLHGNIVEIDFMNFDAFYLFNPFYENLSFDNRLNNEVELNGSRYGYYLKHTENQLDKTKSGTRLVTYHGNNFEIPESFKRIKQTEDGSLKLWIKQ
ncbi:MAG: methyltransferase domain-containing protein [Bacteroidota bacterium]|nr:methyltransferase domain-containing protein [Bacteroidota bacterium]